MSNIYNNSISTFDNCNLFFINISLWKQKTIKNIFVKSNIKFIKSEDIKDIKNDQNNKIIIWGINKFKSIKEEFPKYNFIIIEDGFIRSKSLGSDLAEPLSLIIDNKGIYFDPRSESGLEDIIKNYSLTIEDKQDGLLIKEKILSDNISKYNIDSNIEDNIYKDNNNKNIKIIIGQVEDDASIIFGSNVIKTNLDLIKEVYKTKADNDFLIYKPHPDVTSGNRVGKVKQKEALKYCDYIDNKTPIINILKYKNIEVHTITSLTGFENILRGNTTVCYGNPFYSGWGLTIDVCMPEYIKNRRKNISIDDFFTYAYIKYPVYYDNKKQELTNVNNVIEIIKRTKELKINLYTKIRRRIINFLKRLK
jgi:capsular polysaccharide export protein